MFIQVIPGFDTVTCNSINTCKSLRTLLRSDKCRLPGSWSPNARKSFGKLSAWLGAICCTGRSPCASSYATWRSTASTIRGLRSRNTRSLQSCSNAPRISIRGWTPRSGSRLAGYAPSWLNTTQAWGKKTPGSLRFPKGPTRWHFTRATWRRRRICLCPPRF